MPSSPLVSSSESHPDGELLVSAASLQATTSSRTSRGRAPSLSFHSVYHDEEEEDGGDDRDGVRGSKRLGDEIDASDLMADSDDDDDDSSVGDDATSHTHSHAHGAHASRTVRNPVDVQVMPHPVEAAKSEDASPVASPTATMTHAETETDATPVATTAATTEKDSAATDTVALDTATDTSSPVQLVSKSASSSPATSDDLTEHELTTPPAVAAPSNPKSNGHVEPKAAPIFAAPVNAPSAVISPVTPLTPMESVSPRAVAAYAASSSLVASSFFARHADALDAMEALRRSLEDDLVSLASAERAHAEAFERRLAQLREEEAAATDALEQLAREKTATHARVTRARESVAERSTRLADLAAQVESLESRRLALEAEQRAHVVAAYVIDQPVLTLLTHNVGSRSNNHRRFLRAYRREQRLEQRARGEENIHQASDDEQDEEEEAASASLPAPDAAADSVAECSLVDDDDVAPDVIFDLDESGEPVPPLPRRLSSFASSGPDGAPRLRLPTHLVEHIWTHLGVVDLSFVACVSRTWSRLLTDRTRVWKLLMRRVDGVQRRLAVENEEKEEQEYREARRVSVAVTTQANHVPSLAISVPLPSHATSNGAIASSSPPTPAESSPTPAVLSQLLPDALVTHRRSVSGSSPAIAAAPATSPVASPSGTPGMFGGMMRLWRGSVSASPPGVTPSSSPPTSSASVPPPTTITAVAEGAADEELDDDAATHLHYTLVIEIPTRDLTSLTVRAALARSTADGTRCAADSPGEPVKALNSVTWHVCPLRPASVAAYADELAFCRDLFAVQANLTQARAEQAKARAALDADEGVKRAYTRVQASLERRLHAAEVEIDRVRQQHASDEVTRDFLLDALEKARALRTLESERTAEARRTAEDRLREATQAAQGAAPPTLDQTALHAELRSHKKQLTREVRARQAELERDKAERDRMRDEYQLLVDTIARFRPTQTQS